MTYLVRKISRAKWEPREELGIDAISADAVTSDLRTSGNCLSLWEYTKAADEKELREIALALATNPDNDRIDKIDLAWIEKDAALKEKITFERSEGKTIAFHLRKKHVDAVRLDVTKISMLASLFASSIREYNRFHRFTRNQVKKIISEAIENKQVAIEKLPKKIQEQLTLNKA
ncbi:MAG: hypothetical protein DRG59_06000 [Deltaproteobacteria bacterium]|nr:MAG: hypothetical protein DRG59_06000 [Deltaproteobacteria bacterium]HEC31519.1 hypothetical protein [Deltaproteobacteria bacterium]